MVMIFLAACSSCWVGLQPAAGSKRKRASGCWRRATALHILRFLPSVLAACSKPTRSAAGAGATDHQLVAVEYQVEVAVTVLMGTVAVAFVFVVMGLGAEGGSGQQQGDCFHR